MASERYSFSLTTFRSVSMMWIKLMWVTSCYEWRVVFFITVHQENWCKSNTRWPQWQPALHPSESKVSVAHVVLRWYHCDVIFSDEWRCFGHRKETQVGSLWGAQHLQSWAGHWSYWRHLQRDGTWLSSARPSGPKNCPTILFNVLWAHPNITTGAKSGSYHARIHTIRWRSTLWCVAAHRWMGQQQAVFVSMWSICTSIDLFAFLLTLSWKLVCVKNSFLFVFNSKGAYFAWKATAMGKNHINGKSFLEKRFVDIYVKAIKVLIKIDSSGTAKNWSWRTPSILPS